MRIDSLAGASPFATGLVDQVAKTGAPQAADAAAPAAGGDFASMLGDAIAGVSDQLRKAEAVSIAGIKGTASTQAVVEQVMAAEHTLQTSIAVRDKIVAAYLEISRMAI